MDRCASIAQASAGIIGIFNKAAQDRALVRFEYVDPNAIRVRAEPRCIIPEGPVANGPHSPYVVGFDPARGEYRSFRLDRMILKTVARVTLPESSCAARGVEGVRVIDDLGVSSAILTRRQAAENVTRWRSYDGRAKGDVLGLVLCYSDGGTRLLDREEACAYLGIPA